MLAHGYADMLQLLMPVRGEPRPICEDRVADDDLYNLTKPQNKNGPRDAGHFRIQDR